MIYFRSLNKFLACLLSATMLLDVVHAAPLSPAIAQPAFSIPLPVALGTVTDSYTAPGAKRPDIILIQNLHVNRSVQLAISGLLKHLKGQNLLPAQIAVEGATGLMDTAAMQSYPDAKVRKAASDYLVQQGEMPGAMHFVVTEGQGQLYGVETENVYKANLEVYQRSYKQRLRLKSELEKLASVLSTLRRNLSLRENADLLGPCPECCRKLNSVCSVMV